MSKPEWGLKRTCLGCSARFYDMQRNPIVCPSCGVELDPLASVRPRRARAAAASQAKAKAAAAQQAAEAETEDLPEAVAEDDDALDIDDAAINLDDEDDDGADSDVSEVLEKAKDDGSNLDI